MRRVFAIARAGTVSKAAEMLRDPSLAFGFWCSKFTRLREEIRDGAPLATGPPDKPASPYRDLTPPKRQAKAAP